MGANGQLWMVHSGTKLGIFRRNMQVRGWMDRSIETLNVPFNVMSGPIDSVQSIPVVTDRSIEVTVSERDRC